MQTLKRRVFCAEDHDDTRQLLSLLLGQSDYEVEAAATVAEGLRLARRKSFDLYLLSGRFPDGTGIEMCRHIRQFDKSTPILFYSAAAHESDRERGINAGAQAYIAKPGDIFELVNTVTQLINQSKSGAAPGGRAN
ncbi:MAG TPA: response regulator [Pyrinomonadaceae bacterium]|jgi:DNA-binding response OmpR family regulator|nr:response regulator [Pyrinomonadaceae bacterium]